MVLMIGAGWFVLAFGLSVVVGKVIAGPRIDASLGIDDGAALDLCHSLGLAQAELA